MRSSVWREQKKNRNHLAIAKAVAIIRTRGGSKRIPNKNIKDFHGKPIIHYSITAALSSECFERVIVSTDSKKS